MARPSSEIIEKYDIIQQFQRYSIILELAFLTKVMFSMVVSIMYLKGGLRDLGKAVQQAVFGNKNVRPLSSGSLPEPKQ